VLVNTEEPFNSLCFLCFFENVFLLMYLALHLHTSSVLEGIFEFSCRYEMRLMRILLFILRHYRKQIIT
ncbi:hypothetical protein L9F63_024707, partial [Diploptera punctata]